MFHRLMLKATKFQLPTLKRFSIVVKNMDGLKILKAHLKALNKRLSLNIIDSLLRKLLCSENN